MIQHRTMLKVADNSGAKKLQCIRVLGGYKKRYGTIGDIVTCAVKEAAPHRHRGVTQYALHEGLVDRLFHPGATNRANVAHIMCELATDPEVWAQWRGRLPVIVNASPA